VAVAVVERDKHPGGIQIIIYSMESGGGERYRKNVPKRWERVKEGMRNTDGYIW
jgi:hypothetical protein